MTQKETGRACPTCAGTGRIAQDTTERRDLNQLTASGDLVYIPRPEPVTLTREQYDQLLINNCAHSR